MSYVRLLKRKVSQCQPASASGSRGPSTRLPTPNFTGNQLRLASLTASLALLWCFTIVTCHAQQYQDATLRFFDNNSRPDELQVATISPNGMYVVLSLKDDGISIVEIPSAQVVAALDSQCSAVAFSADSKKLFCTGGLWGPRLIDLDAGIKKSVNLPELVGRTGIHLEKRQGKLMITALPAHLQILEHTVQIGDEVVAVRPGEKPILDDVMGWKSLLGKDVDAAVKLITGPPGTWVQLKVKRSGASESLEFAVQRMWPRSPARAQVTNGLTLAAISRFGEVVLRAAPTGLDYAHVHRQHVKDSALYSISADATLLAFAGEMKSERGYGLEIHDLATDRLLVATELTFSAIQKICFSHDGKYLLVGTRDSIEIFDVGANTWQESLLLAPERERDFGEVVQRRHYGGFGFPGDLYLTVPEIVYSTPAPLINFDITPSKTIAIASEDGKIALASLDERRIFGVVGDEILEGPVDFMQFTPDGRYLVAYSEGMLHIISKSSTTK